ncbi:hypothetical protein BX661DRAFT_187993 [Kickxella alabastrina]|uniref:uncharacterized protein n=1 Tax=Kickxella alabastrina TaxID=61397 RepID=UPI00222106A8|nr:uncharacterized protein BX661DRAFT_187993 [Kickxella alabastrina]KAI7821808.1 hypothetical protein BX661DRAFT_187993 [Kickxella alabastrina]
MAQDDNGRWVLGSRPYKIRVGVVLTIFVIYIIYVIVTFTMFIIKARDKHSGLLQRNVRLVTLQVVGCFLMGISGMISTSLQQWPCFLKLWLVNSGYVLLYSSVAARACQHIVVSNLHTMTNKLAGNNNPMFKESPKCNMKFLRQTTRANRSASQTSIMSNTDFDPSDGIRALDEKKDGPDHSKHILQASMHLGDGADSRTYKRLKKYSNMQRFVTDKSLFLFVIGHLVVALIMSLVINIVNKQFSISPTSNTCTMMWGFIPIVVIVGLYSILILPFLFVKCWPLKDAYGIRNDILVSSLVGIFTLIMTIVWETVLFHIALKWSGWFFSWVCGIFCHTVSVTVPLYGAIRHSRDVIHRMHGASSLGTSMAAVISGAGGSNMGKRAEFNAILSDPYEYRFFCDFAASCFCSEMCAFIDEYQALKGMTVIALGSEDIWREDVDQLDPSYMTRMATHNSDSNAMGYLAIANNNNINPNAKSLRVQTPPTVSILDTAKGIYPQYDLNDNTPFPVASMDRLVAIFSVFVNSNSYTAVNLPSSMVLRIREKLSRSQLTLTILDEVKDEVLNMLYFDVYTRYTKKR